MQAIVGTLTCSYIRKYVPNTAIVCCSEQKKDLQHSILPGSNNNRSPMILQVLSKLGPKVVQKCGVEHLLQPSHLLPVFRKRYKYRVFQIPVPPREIPLRRSIYGSLVVLGVMDNVVDCELCYAVSISRPNNSSGIIPRTTSPSRQEQAKQLQLPFVSEGECSNREAG